MSLMALAGALLMIPSLSATEQNQYMDMSLKDLLNVEVSSVSRKQELLRHSGAAAFVISSEDIRRSGVTSIPEALRMVPGVNVARINSNEWAVSARGFNGRFAIKLLVQIDGRSVYTPSFSGVYWDVQDTMLEDIDRIEVIRGPGATMWGSNAVNGIINIITKQAIDTQGGLLVAGGGSLENSGSMRYGGAISDSMFGRGYVRYLKRNDLVDSLTALPAGDSWDSLRGGFRVDSDLSGRDTVTFQGNIYNNKENQFVAQLPLATFPFAGSVADKVKVSGLNTLVRWKHVLNGGDSTALQLYFDRAKRDEVLAGQQYDTIDADFQHHLSLGGMQDVIWGLGYRNVREKARNTYAVSLLAPKASNNLISAFFQDDIRLGMDDLHLILGSKFEQNDFTGWEVQPNVRMTWAADDYQTIWAAVSRAVRTPSRVEAYGRAVTGFTVAPPVVTPNLALGNANVKSESLIAYELGYRSQIEEKLNIDIALFYNVYDRLRSFEPVPASANIMVGNKIKGHGYGAEVAVDWQTMPWWQLRLAYSYLKIKLHTVDGGTDTSSLISAESSSPKHQVSLRSSMSLLSNVEVDIWGRYNSGLGHANASAVVAGTQPIAAYAEMDIRFGWRPSKTMEFSIIGKNLLHANHAEFIQESNVQFIRPTSIQRSVFGQVSLQF